MLVIGSAALKRLVPDSREPKDIDLVISKPDALAFIEEKQARIVHQSDYIISVRLPNKQMVEMHLVMPQEDGYTNSWGNYLYHESLTPYEELEGIGKVQYASASTLFSIKKAHIHFPTHIKRFKKHVHDLGILYEYVNGVDTIPNLTKDHYKATEERIGKLRTPSLMKSTKDFFGQSEGYVKSWFVHDHIHEVMAHHERPLYESMQPEQGMVTCSKDMWNDFSFEDKCKTVLEEAYVIALERKIIPMLYGGGTFWTAADALDWALMRICTNLCSGWFRAFATYNHTHIQKYINPKYVEHFLTKVQNNEIQLIENGKVHA